MKFILIMLCLCIINTIKANDNKSIIKYLIRITNDTLVEKTDSSLTFLHHKYIISENKIIVFRRWDNSDKFKELNSSDCNFDIIVTNKKISFIYNGKFYTFQYHYKYAYNTMDLKNPLLVFIQSNEDGVFLSINRSDNTIHYIDFREDFSFTPTI